MNVVVGCLFLARSGASERASLGDVLRSLPSIVASGLAYRLSPSDWPSAAIAVHDAFALLSIVSLVTLGRSFAILPARRAIVARGPYRLVRHPIYLAELGMVVTACATRGWLAGVGAFLVMLVLVAPRILAEEKLLGVDAAYDAYRARVRHRLLPWLF